MTDGARLGLGLETNGGAGGGGLIGREILGHA